MRALKREDQLQHPVPHPVPQGQTRKPGDILEQIEITRDPRDMLARFFLKAVAAAAARDITFEFGTFDELLAVNEANRDSWRPLTTSFHPDMGCMNDDNGLVILGRNSKGEVVATQSTIYYDWRKTTLKEEAESLRLFYGEPAKHKRANEACIVNTPEAADITGDIVLSGAIWYRPDYRGIGLANIVPRFTRAISYLQWDIDEFVALVTHENTKKQFSQRTGLGETAGSIIVRDHSILPGQDFETRLARITPLQLIDDLFGFMLDFSSEIDTGVNKRRA